MSTPLDKHIETIANQTRSTQWESDLLGDMKETREIVRLLSNTLKEIDSYTRNVRPILRQEHFGDIQRILDRAYASDVFKIEQR